jgi:fumarate reductase subunit C
MMASSLSHDVREDRMKTKEYIRPMPATWFLRNRYLVLYALRETSSFFVAGYAIFLMVLLARQGQGREAFNSFFNNVLQSPLSLILHLIVLAFVVLHSVTSFDGMAKIMVIRQGEDRVSPALIAGVLYAVWIVVSLLILIGVLSW